MARQNIRSNPAEKLFEAYMDFSGGLNTETSNEKLRDNEYPVLENVDLASRGSAKRRTGRRSLFSVPGNGQGLFYFYRKGASEPDIITAVSGKLYKFSDGDIVATEVKMKDGEDDFTFQTTLPVEAVQYGEELFIATGTKFIELAYFYEPFWESAKYYEVGEKVKTTDGRVYECTVTGTTDVVAPVHTSGTAMDGTVEWKYIHDEWYAKTVTPYTPSVLEAIYIGTNGLADNPDAYVQDGESTKLEIVGIKPSKRTGVVNESLSMTAYINKPQSITDVEYRWEYKKSIDTTYTLLQDWGENNLGKTTSVSFPAATDYDIMVTVRDKAVPTTTVSYVMGDYKVNTVEDKSQNTSRPVNGMQRCRKVLLFWDRLILSGDDTNPYQMYVSDLNAPRYFPVSNTISFDTGKQEPITAIVRFRDMLVVFSKTTIQTLNGKSPEDYRRSLIHDGIGCIAPRSAKVTGNNILFLSSEGIHYLKPNSFALEVMNVSRVDYPIKSDVIPAENACAMVFDSQYWLCFPSASVIYRLYYDNAMWVRDVSSQLSFVEMSHYGSDVYELSETGTVYKHDRTRYDDDGEIYTVTVESKYFDLSASFNIKKLKKLYILARHFLTDVNMGVMVKADSSIVLTPEVGRAIIDEEGFTTWEVTTEPNLHFYSGTTVGSWILARDPLGDVQLSVQKATIRGKCRRVKIIFTHTESVPCELYGFGLEFKSKKP